MPQQQTSGLLTTAHGLPPHAGMPVHTFGLSVDRARLVVVLVHGRGAGPAGIASLSEELGVEDAAYIVPEASGHVWYPFSFLSPVEANEPGLSSGLSVLDGIVTECDRAGVMPDRIVLAGFSQGACLAMEYAIRHPRRYRAILGFSGGLIGPPGTTWGSGKDLTETSVFLGCGDQDMHIPADRVRESAEAFRLAGASVDMRLYPGMPHTIQEDEIIAARRILLEQQS